MGTGIRSRVNWAEVAVGISKHQGPFLDMAVENPKSKVALLNV